MPRWCFWCFWVGISPAQGTVQMAQTQRGMRAALVVLALWLNGCDDHSEVEAGDPVQQPKR